MTSSHIDSVYLKLKYELTQVEHQLLEQQFAAAKRIMHLEEIVATLSEKVNVAPEPPKTPPAVVINNKTSQTTDELGNF